MSWFLLKCLTVCLAFYKSRLKLWLLFSFSPAQDFTKSIVSCSPIWLDALVVQHLGAGRSGEEDQRTLDIILKNKTKKMIPQQLRNEVKYKL